MGQRPGPKADEGKYAERVIPRAFGNRLREVRGELGVSQTDLVEASGVHRTEISLIERGGREPRLGTLLRLAGGLSVDASVLLRGIGSWRPAHVPDTAGEADGGGSDLTVADSGDLSGQRPSPVVFVRPGLGGPLPDEEKYAKGIVARAFGNRLREVRDDRRVTQGALADAVGLNRTEISLLERGGREPRVGTLLRLAGGLSVDPAVLVEGLLSSRPARGAQAEDVGGARAVRGTAEERGDFFYLSEGYEVSPAQAAEKISETVVSHRQKRGWTQRELAERAKIRRTDITSIELALRMPPADVIVRLAAGFDVELSELVEGVPAVRLPPGVPRFGTAAADGATAAIDEEEEQTDIAERFARNLVLLRRRAGLSQRTLSEISGVVRTRIGHFEARTGTPNLVMLEKLAEALDVPPSMLIDKLLDDEDNPS